MNKKKLLLVDDSKPFTTILKINLEKTGEYEVITENNPSKAVEIAKRNMPDLIMLDIKMPGTSGFGVLRQLKDNLDTASIPTIMFTGLDSEHAKHKAGKLYCDDYIEKTEEMSIIRKKIKKVLNQI